MFEKFDTDRGQVGIGTLIVFIAMVLVAAIAAGVLVNTAGFLQATAQDAGQESVNKVTNRVDVVSTHGIVNDEANELTV
ncbi:flagellin, partial [Halogeometricum borinquense]